MRLTFLGFSPARARYSGPEATLHAGEWADFTEPEAARLLSDFPNAFRPAIDPGGSDRGPEAPHGSSEEPDPGPGIGDMDVDALRALYASLGGTEDVSRRRSSTIRKLIDDLRGTPEEG